MSGVVDFNGFMISLLRRDINLTFGIEKLIHYSNKDAVKRGIRIPKILDILLKKISIETGLSVNQLILNAIIEKYVLPYIGYNRETLNQLLKSNVKKVRKGESEIEKLVERWNNNSLIVEIGELIAEIEARIEDLKYLQKLSHGKMTTEDFREMMKTSKRIGETHRKINLILNNKQIREKLEQIEKQQPELIKHLTRKIDEFMEIYSETVNNHKNIIRLLKKL